MKFLLIIFLSFYELYGQIYLNAKNDCNVRPVLIYENSIEKVFELKNSIYKIKKRTVRDDTKFYIFDLKKSRFKEIKTSK